MHSLLHFLAMTNTNPSGFFPEKYANIWIDSTFNGNGDTAINTWESKVGVICSDGKGRMGSFELKRYKNWDETGLIAEMNSYSNWIENGSQIFERTYDSTYKEYWSIKALKIGIYQLELIKWERGNIIGHWKFSATFSKDFYEQVKWNQSMELTSMEYQTLGYSKLLSLNSMKKEGGCNQLFVVGNLVSENEDVNIDFNPYGNKVCDEWYKITLTKGDEYICSF